MNQFVVLLIILSLLHPSMVNFTKSKYFFILAGQSNMQRNFSNMENSLKAAYGPDILIIKTAVGGTSITQWQRGQKEYINTVQQSKLAVSMGYKCGVLFFFQGERDSRNKAYGKVWGKLFLLFIDDFSKDIKVSGLKVVFAQLGKIPTPGSYWPGWYTVRRQQAAVMDERPQYKMVHTLDIGPYNTEEGGSIGPHYHDDVVDKSWQGTGYSLITRRFLNNSLILLPLSP